MMVMMMVVVVMMMKMMVVMTIMMVIGAVVVVVVVVIKNVTVNMRNNAREDRGSYFASSNPDSRHCTTVPELPL